MQSADANLQSYSRVHSTKKKKIPFDHLGRSLTQIEAQNAQNASKLAQSRAKLQELARASSSKLSQVVKDSIETKPGHERMEITKLSAVEKAISEIDQLPEQFRNVETVFLSNNNLTDLSGLRQLRNVTTLSLMNNLVSDLSQIEHLVALPRLTTLSLEFNPITQTPNYRAHVICRLPNLKSLDSKEITPAERTKAQVALKKEETMLNLMLSNEFTILKLKMATNKLRLHDQLRLEVLGSSKIRPVLSASSLGPFTHSSNPFDTNKFLTLCDIEKSVTRDEKRRMIEKLKKDVKRARNLRMFGAGSVKSSMDDVHGRKVVTSTSQFSEPWDVSFSEAMLAQQHTIAKLITQLEEEAKKIADQQQRVAQRPSELSRLLEQQDARNETTRQEREHLILELRSTIDHLVGEFQEDRSEQAFEYERKIEELQSQLQTLNNTTSVDFFDNPITLSALQSRHPPSLSFGASYRAPLDQDIAVDFQDPDYLDGPTQPEQQLSSQEARFSPIFEQENGSMASHLPPQQREPASPPHNFQTDETYDDDLEGFQIHQPSQPQQNGRGSKLKAPQTYSDSGIPEPSTKPTRVAPATSLGRTLSKQLRSSTTNATAPIPSAAPSGNTTGFSSQGGGGFKSRIPAASMGGPVSPTSTKSDPNTLLSRRLRSSSANPLPLASDNTRPDLTINLDDRDAPSDEVSTLKRQVKMLQGELQQRAIADQRMQNINMQLREKLEAYHKQNRDNVETAEHEMASLQQELQRVERERDELVERLQMVDQHKSQAEIELARRIEEIEAENMRLVQAIGGAEAEMENRGRQTEEMNEHADKLDAELKKTRAYVEKLENLLASARAESQALQSKAEEYGKELEAVFVGEENEERASQFRRVRLLRNSLRSLRSKCSEAKEDRMKIERARQFYEYKILQRSIHEWVSFVQILQFTRRSTARRQLELATRCFAALQLTAALARQTRHARHTRLANTAMRCMRGWMEYTSYRKTMAQKKMLADEHHNLTLQRRVLLALRSSVDHLELDQDTERLLTVRALTKRAELLQRSCFYHWRDYISGPSATQRQNKEIAHNFHVRSLVSRHFSIWRQRQQEAQQTKLRVAFVDSWFREHMRHRVLNSWTRYVAHRKYKAQLNVVAQRFFVQRFFRKWIHHTRESKIEGLKHKQAASFHNRTLLRRFFTLLARAAGDTQETMRKDFVAEQHHSRRLQWDAFRRWRWCVHQVRAEKNQESQQKMENLSLVFQSWRYFAQRSIYLKQCATRAAVMRTATDQRKVAMILAAWRSWTKMKKRHHQLSSRLIGRYQRRVLRRAFEGWRVFVCDATRSNFMSLRDEYLKLQTALEDHQAVAGSTEIENAHYIDSIQQLTAEITKQQRLFVEKESEMNDLQKTIEENALVESSLRSEIDQHRSQIVELEHEIQSLQRSMHSGADEAQVSAMELTLQLTSAMEQIRALTTQLQDREHELQMTQQSLQEAALRLEEVQMQSHEKLTAAFEIAAQLRDIVEERDKQIAEYASREDEANVKLSDYQQKLSVSSNSLTKAIEDRDAKIQELQLKFSALQMQVNEASTRILELTAQLDEKNAAIKKLQYEIQLATAREEERQQRFLSDLKSAAREPFPSMSLSQPQQSNEMVQQQDSQQGNPVEDGSAMLDLQGQQQQQSSMSGSGLYSGAMRLQLDPVTPDAKSAQQPMYAPMSAPFESARASLIGRTTTTNGGSVSASKAFSSRPGSLGLGASAQFGALQQPSVPVRPFTSSTTFSANDLISPVTPSAPRATGPFSSARASLVSQLQQQPTPSSKFLSTTAQSPQDSQPNTPSARNTASLEDLRARLALRLDTKQGSSTTPSAKDGTLSASALRSQILSSSGALPSFTDTSKRR